MLSCLLFLFKVSINIILIGMGFGFLFIFLKLMGFVSILMLMVFWWIYLWLVCGIVIFIGLIGRFVGKFCFCVMMWLVKLDIIILLLINGLVRVLIMLFWFIFLGRWWI